MDISRVAERNRTAAKQIHSLPPVTNTESGHSGRSGSRTRKALSYSTGFQPVPVAHRVALPLFHVVVQWPDQDSNPERPVRSRV
jgi:hypothetical protein